MGSQLIEACKNGDLETVKTLLTANVNVDYPLCLASEHGHLEIVKLLLALGANLHVHGNAPLRRASENNHPEVVKVLITFGANINACDNDSLYRAANYGHFEVVKVLLTAGANVTDYQYLFWPIAFSHLDIVKLLLLHYPNENVIKQKYPKFLTLYNRQIRGLRRFQLHVLDILWRPGGRMCNRNYTAMTAKN